MWTPALRNAPNPLCPPPTNLITILKYFLKIVLKWPGTPPAVEGHDAVMEDVEEGEMAVLLLQEKHHWVGHVNNLREVEDPGHVESPESLRVLGVVHGFTLPAVVPAHEKSRRWGSVERLETNYITSNPPWTPRSWGRSETDCNNGRNSSDRTGLCLS